MPEYPKNLIGTAYEKYYNDNQVYKVPEEIKACLGLYYHHRRQGNNGIIVWDKEADLQALDKLFHHGWSWQAIAGTFWFSKTINGVKITRKLDESNYRVNGVIEQLEIRAPITSVPVKAVPVSTDRFSDMDYLGD